MTFGICETQKSNPRCYLHLFEDFYGFQHWSEFFSRVINVCDILSSGFDILFELYRCK